MTIPGILGGKDLQKSNWLSLSLLLASLVLFIGVLNWAEEVLIPLALAILLTFILSPIVTVLHRRGLGRTPAVALTVLFVFALIAAIAAVIAGEFQSLANELPAHRHTIRKKVLQLRSASKGGAIENVQKTVQDVLQEIEKDSDQGSQTNAVPVVIAEKSLATQASPLLGSLLAPLGTAAFVVVLSVFMLLRREDLRNRFLRVAGYDRLAATTKAIDEAGTQVSKYLLRQSLLNAGYGACLGIGLFFIGVPYVILWSVLAAIARFVPYVGPWIGAVAPVLMSLAVHDGWTAPFLVAGLVLVLELICNLGLEPILYGKSIGVSEVALLIMMAFWTWLWGPIGLVLAAPLTVCLMVFSKGVKELEFIGLLLGSETVTEPTYAFYQRLIADDRVEATEIAQKYAKENSTLLVFEDLFIPALAASRADLEREGFTSEDYDRVLLALKEIMVELRPKDPSKPSEEPAPQPVEPHRVLVCGWPANDQADAFALMMLGELLPKEGWELRVLAADKLVSENIQEVVSVHPAVVCIGLLPGKPLFAVRQFCKRLRSRNAHCRIVAGVWGSTRDEGISQQLEGLVDALSHRLGETKNQVLALGQVALHEPNRGRRYDERRAGGSRRRHHGGQAGARMKAATETPALQPAVQDSGVTEGGTR